MAAAVESLRLEAFSDRDLLYILDDVVEDDGYTSSETVAATIFPTVFKNGNDDRKRRARQCVAIRLSWMRRIGVVERAEDLPRSHPSRWALTPEGVLFMKGDVPKGVQTALDKLAENQLLGTTAWLTEQYTIASPVAAHMMNRAWRYGVHQRVNGGKKKRRRR